MAKESIVLTTGKGKNKRQWELSAEEFQEFEMLFEENELIDLSCLKLALPQKKDN